MPEPQAVVSFTPRKSALIVALMLAMVAVPAAITLNTVRSPVTLEPTSSDPSPYGYTWSLLLFIVPIVVITGWLLPREGLKLPRKAFNWTLIEEYIFYLTGFTAVLLLYLWLSEYWLAAEVVKLYQAGRSL